MKMARRFLALLLAFTLAFCTLGTAALAAEATERELGGSGGVVVREDVTPMSAPRLGAAPVERQCCALHFVLTLAALGVAVYYAWDRKWRQAREFEVRAEL